jgi:predicted dinucleotide-binding enzyme
MRVGIVGSGGVAQSLAAGFAEKGHQVMMGTRDPKASLARTQAGPDGTPGLGTWAKGNPKVKVATMAEAAKHGEFVVMAVHGKNIEEAVKAAGPENLAGKLVLDTTNPLEFTPKGVHKPANIKDSCLQAGQRAAPKARFVKALNCTPNVSMVDPKQPGSHDQFICGDDPKAKEQAAKILKELGWKAADVGDSSMAPYIEAVALAAINWAAKTNDWGWIIGMNGRTAN